MDRKFALIGHPLGHSLSPQIHKRLFELDGKEAEYSLLDIAPEKLSESFGGLKKLDGFNITIPHKVSIIPLCDRLSTEAERYGSVNCVKAGEETIGYNTDVLGFTKSIEQLGASLSSKVLQLGCGGVGRMMAIETALSGGSLTVAVLKSDEPLALEVKKEVLAQKPDAEFNIVIIGGKVLDASDFGTEMPQFDLLVNACPVGMFPNVDRMPCAKNVLEGVKYVFDVIYNPCETLLYKTAVQMGAKAMTGMAMLVLQAVAAHEIWDGASYKQSDIDALIREMELSIS